MSEIARNYPSIDTAPDGRIWLPDAVAWLWNDLGGRNELWRLAFNQGIEPPRSSSAMADLLGTQGITWRNAARSGNGWVPEHILHEVATARGITLLDRVVAHLRLLVALDRACEGLNLTEPRIIPELAELVLHASSSGNGNLARFAQATVLRKATRKILRGASLPQYLQNLAPIDASASGPYHVVAALVPESTRLVHRPGSVGRVLTVGFMPVLDELTDVTFVPVQRGQAQRFTIILDPAKQKRVAGEMMNLVEAMERKGVELLLLPETCAEQPLVEALRQALMANFNAHGGNPALRLAFIGRLAPQENSVIVLSGAGETLLQQKKQQPWRLDDRQQRRYGLVGALSIAGTTSVERDEDILLSTPPTLTALDDPGFGRLIVLICEDLERYDPAKRIAVDVGPTHVISPIMDASLEVNRWACKAAAVLTNDPGALVLVINSSLLSLREAADKVSPKLAHSSSGPSPGPGIGHIAHPEYEVAKALNGGIVRLVPCPLTFAVQQVSSP